MEPPKPKPSSTILEEDAYLATLNRIIEKDFYPDLPKLRNQLEWLEALENDDAEKMREIQQRMSTQRRPLQAATPAFASPAATPVSRSVDGLPHGHGPAVPSTPGANSVISEAPAPGGAEAASLEQTVADKAAALAERLSLGAFQARYTSEDNHSFSKLMEAAAARHRLKYDWLFKAQAEQQLLLEGPKGAAGGAGGGGAGGGAEESAQLLTWKYEPRNQLMYHPDGAPYTAVELAAMAKGPPKETVLANTRFHASDAGSGSRGGSGAATPVGEGEKDKEKTPIWSEASAAVRSGLWMPARRVPEERRIDLDDLQPGARPAEQSPQVRGYGFVATPSPAPHAAGGASPFITWGAIEGALLVDPTDTPLRLDPAAAAGPKFKVPETPRRELVAQRLVEQASQRAKAGASAAQRESQKRQLSELASPRRRPVPLSPAAVDLAQRAGRAAGGLDLQLRASYQSPLHKGAATPLFPLTPSPAPSPKGATPQAGATPAQGHGQGQAPAPKRAKPSITDNLLHLPPT